MALGLLGCVFGSTKDSGTDTTTQIGFELATQIMIAISVYARLRSCVERAAARS